MTETLILKNGVNIDLGGHTLTVYAREVDGGHFNACTGVVVFSNGSINRVYLTENGQHMGVIEEITADCNVTFNGVKIDCGGDASVFIDIKNNGVLSFNNCNISNMDKQKFMPWGGTIMFTDCTLTNGIMSMGGTVVLKNTTVKGITYNQTINANGEV